MRLRPFDFLPKTSFFIIAWFFLKCIIPFSKNKKYIFLVRIVFAAKLSNVGEFIRILSTSLFGVFSCMMMCSTIKRPTVFMTTISKSQFYVTTLVTFHYGIKIMLQDLQDVQTVKDKTSTLPERWLNESKLFSECRSVTFNIQPPRKPQQGHWQWGLLSDRSRDWISIFIP